MGGPVGKNFSANENKILSNIDAGRNKPLRDKRSKELEAERVAQQAVQLKPTITKPAPVKPTATSRVSLEKEGVVRDSVSGNSIGYINKLNGKFQSNVYRNYSESVSGSLSTLHESKKDALAHMAKLAPTLKPNGGNSTPSFTTRATAPKPNFGR